MYFLFAFKDYFMCDLDFVFWFEENRYKIFFANWRSGTFFKILLKTKLDKENTIFTRGYPLRWTRRFVEIGGKQIKSDKTRVSINPILSLSDGNFCVLNIHIYLIYMTKDAYATIFKLICQLKDQIINLNRKFCLFIQFELIPFNLSLCIFFRKTDHWFLK